MCGIAGMVTNSSAGSLDPFLSRLRGMCDALAHRGPDGRGFFVEASGLSPQQHHARLERLMQPPFHTLPTWLLEHVGPSHGARVGLAMRRLAVVDVANGRQPITNERQTLFAVLNGELYNYRSLQAHLRDRGHTLRSEADSEVLVHLYEEYGIEGTLERLDGMFAFALWDSERQLLHIARDALGEKPLYYLERPGELRFASELKGLLVCRDVERRLDPQAVEAYLIQEAVPSPLTIYTGIHKLPPGHRLSWHSGTLEHSRWWHPPTPALLKELQAPQPERNALRQLEASLREAVHSRLIGEVPTGVLLSGGLDSSLVAAFAREEVADLQTFSIGFEEKSFDEGKHAARVATHLRTRHHHQVLCSQALPELLEALGQQIDEPLADGSLVPTLALMRLARSHGLVVALGGDGGDEAFGGYPTYVALQLAPRLEQLGAQALSGLRWLGERVPASYGDIPWDFKLRRTLLGLGHAPVLRHALWMCGLSPGELAQVLISSPDANQLELRLSTRLQPLAEQLEGHAWLDAAQLQDLLSYLPEDLLVKSDRASMAVGIELRAPLLAPVAVHAGLGLPPTQRIKGRTTKVALRKLGENRLPAEILRRPKKGFGMPTGQWLRTLPEDLVRSWLRPPPHQPPLFHATVVDEWLELHRRGGRELRKRLWPILMLELWRRGPWGPGGTGSV